MGRPSPSNTRKDAILPETARDENGTSETIMEPILRPDKMLRPQLWKRLPTWSRLCRHRFNGWKTSQTARMRWRPRSSDLR
ncbi:hypothetical protein CROQUDRAFT_659021 [Cronartium quercuum f. sp. fusiforme G11]|uniref:Uncharacterized protein n=1 Tax=Cronartium quercuum f. sp. fusiforme G11 TaxID=708437 RepID=A0A9P6TB23_9BASI|nr:hypothetical protein CROQUDRAFT_659021 [Cronartium quercuum f. sp. fusiforme G11]